MMKLQNQYAVIIKYFTSFFKRDWQLKDYPIRFKKQVNVLEENEWSVQIINWWVVCGLGKTKEEAYKKLEESFYNCTKNKIKKPRPGTKVKIEFADTVGIDENSILLDEFLEKILGFSIDDPVFISDESSLYDFALGNKIDEYVNKIHEYYKIDIRDEENGNILNILERIKESRSNGNFV